MGFSCKWLVSLTKGDRHRRMSMQAVSCEILYSKELLNEQSGLLSPCTFSEKE